MLSLHLSTCLWNVNYFILNIVGRSWGVTKWQQHSRGPERGRADWAEINPEADGTIQTESAGGGFELRDWK